ncbi:MAG: hypothetical protein NVSMB5_05390 [Candidatus Velthaea sp.]
MSAALIVLAIASGAAFGLPLFAVAVFAARPFARAATRFRIYAAAFIAAALFAPSALLFSLLRPAAPAMDGPLDARLTGHTPPVIIATIAFVAIVLLGDLALDLICLMRIKSRSYIDPTQPPQARNAPVAASRRVRTPTAIGYLHPRIVLPADLGGRVSADEFRAIVAHENAHLARYDDWSKAMQTAIVRLSWFAPALWALAARLDLEREVASDERVLCSAAVDPRAYAACLVRLASDVRHPRPAPAAWTARSQVAFRVDRLLRPAVSPPRLRGALGLLTLAVALALGGLGSALVVPGAHHPAPAAPVVGVLEPLRSFALERRTTPPTIRPAPVGKPVVLVRKATLPIPVSPIAARSAYMGQNARAVRRRAKPVAARIRLAPALEQVAAVAPISPCRMCVMLRRPVVDGPELPVEPAVSHSVAVPDSAALDGVGLEAGRGYPWEPEVLPWQARGTRLKLAP